MTHKLSNFAQSHIRVKLNDLLKVFLGILMHKFERLNDLLVGSFGSRNCKEKSL